VGICRNQVPARLVLALHPRSVAKRLLPESSDGKRHVAPSRRHRVGQRVPTAAEGRCLWLTRAVIRIRPTTSSAGRRLRRRHHWAPSGPAEGRSRPGRSSELLLAPASQPGAVLERLESFRRIPRREHAPAVGQVGLFLRRLAALASGDDPCGSCLSVQTNIEHHLRSRWPLGTRLLFT
jgi:hypothetical protein